MRNVAIATLSLILAAATTSSFAAERAHPTDTTRQYESLVQRDIAPAVFEQGRQQGRTINAWGHTFTMK